MDAITGTKANLANAASLNVQLPTTETYAEPPICHYSQKVQIDACLQVNFILLLPSCKVQHFVNMGIDTYSGCAFAFPVCRALISTTIWRCTKCLIHRYGTRTVEDKGKLEFMVTPPRPKEAI